MEDKQNLVTNEEENDLRDPPELIQQCNEHPGDVIITDVPSYPPPVYTLTAHPVVTSQPLPMMGVVVRSSWSDDSEIKTIRNKAITSVALSTALSACLCPILCSLPALILGIIALCILRKDTSKANIYANISLGLVIAGAIFITVFFTLHVIFQGIYI